MLPVTYGKKISKIARSKGISWEILRFSCPKIQFSSHEIQFSSTAFYFLQWLSAFLNGFPIFFNAFSAFLNGFPLSDESEKIYLWRQVYKRTLFKLRISRNLLPELRNSCYNVYISPNTLLWCTCVPNSAPNLN